MTCTVDQPGFVEAYEQTAIYSKVSGFIKKYYVDIGQQVKKGDLMVEIFVPELNEDHQQKVAQVDLDQEWSSSATDGRGGREQTPDGDCPTGRGESQRGEVPGGHRSLGVGSAAFDARWSSSGSWTGRCWTKPRNNSLESSRRATPPWRRWPHGTPRGLRRGRLGKAKIDVETAKAQVKVAEAEERRTAAMLAYTKVTAPYDGVITVRNANTGDYVQAATGDKSTSRGSPMFVIARDDMVRIFVDVPEEYARYVREGTKANVRADALSGLEIRAAVTRTSWSLVAKDPNLAGGDRPLDQEPLTIRPRILPPPPSTTSPAKTTTGCGPACTSTQK